jgi:integrase
VRQQGQITPSAPPAAQPRHSGVELHKRAKRDALEARREPYWGSQLKPGQHVGLRKIDDGRASWIARYRDKATGERSYKALDVEVTAEADGGYHAARAAAEKWFKLMARGIQTDDVKTVADACAAYVAERRKAKGDACAHDAFKRFERTVYSEKTFSSIELTKLTGERVRTWFHGLKLKPAAANRTLTALKAALNLAVGDHKAPSELSSELRGVKPIPGADKRRKLYLTRAQRQKLRGAAPKGGIRDLIEATILTGARAGELVHATVSQFNVRTKEMTFTGKTGTRDTLLSPTALRLFRRLAKGKAPTDLLLTRDDGKPWAHGDWDQLVRAAAEKAGLPTDRGAGVCLYTLRHSYITDAVNAGNSTLTVARAVGTSLTMIDKFYGKSTDAARKRLATLAVL